MTARVGGAMKILAGRQEASRQDVDRGIGTLVRQGDETIFLLLGEYPVGGGEIIGFPVTDDRPQQLDVADRPRKVSPIAAASRTLESESRTTCSRGSAASLASE